MNEGHCPEWLCVFLVSEGLRVQVRRVYLLQSLRTEREYQTQVQKNDLRKNKGLKNMY